MVRIRDGVPQGGASFFSASRRFAGHKVYERGHAGVAPAFIDITLIGCETKDLHVGKISLQHFSGVHIFNKGRAAGAELYLFWGVAMQQKNSAGL